jgi:hypothetical protein
MLRTLWDGASVGEARHLERSLRFDHWLTAAILPPGFLTGKHVLLPFPAQAVGRRAVVAQDPAIAQSAEQGV